MKRMVAAVLLALAGMGFLFPAGLSAEFHPSDYFTKTIRCEGGLRIEPNVRAYEDRSLTPWRYRFEGVLSEAPDTDMSLRVTVYEKNTVGDRLASCESFVQPIGPGEIGGAFMCELIPQRQPPAGFAYTVQWAEEEVLALEASATGSSAAVAERSGSAAGGTGNPLEEDRLELTYVTGQAVDVFDGDTMLIRADKGNSTFTCRLYGIDTPEKPDAEKGWGGQPLAFEAESMLLGLVFGRALRIGLTGEQSYGREICVVELTDTAAGGASVNLVMIEQGFAWAYRHYLKIPYLAPFIQAEARAREARLGLWRGGALPEAPWDYRRRMRGDH